MSLAASVAFVVFDCICGSLARSRGWRVLKMSQDELDVRLPIESEDEFGVLAQAFNHMADHACKACIVRSKIGCLKKDREVAIAKS